MSKRPKGWEVKVHPHHVAAVDALTGKVKLGTKTRPGMSNRTIATLLDLDMKTVKALKEDKGYRERVMARTGPLAPSKDDMASPILAELKELRVRVKALEQPAEVEPVATEAEGDRETEPTTRDAPPGGTPGEPDSGGGGEGEATEETESAAAEVPSGAPERKGPLDFD